MTSRKIPGTWQIGITTAVIATAFVALFLPILLVVLAVYVAILTALAVSAVRYRGTGWRSGIFLVLVLATIPAWVAALYWLFLQIQQLLPTPP